MNKFKHLPCIIFIIFFVLITIQKVSASSVTIKTRQASQICKWWKDHSGFALAVNITCMIPGPAETPLCAVADIINYGCDLEAITVETGNDRIKTILTDGIIVAVSDRNPNLEIILNSYNTAHQLIKTTISVTATRSTTQQQNNKQQPGFVDNVNNGIQRGTQKMYEPGFVDNVNKGVQQGTQKMYGTPGGQQQNNQAQQRQQPTRNQQPQQQQQWNQQQPQQPTRNQQPQQQQQWNQQPQQQPTRNQQSQQQQQEQQRQQQLRNQQQEQQRQQQLKLQQEQQEKLKKKK